jgi:hypothetical protein
MSQDALRLTLPPIVDRLINKRNTDKTRKIYKGGKSIVPHLRKNSKGGKSIGHHLRKNNKGGKSVGPDSTDYFADR